jgi:hypothetical protein
MKIIILLLILVSCGKDPVKSSKSPSIEKLTETTPIEETGYVPIETSSESTTTGTTTGGPVETPVEMVEIECKIQNACQTVCINDANSCENICDQNTANNSQAENACMWQCQNAAQACYNKKIQIPKDEYDWIMSH